MLSEVSFLQPKNQYVELRNFIKICFFNLAREALHPINNNPNENISLILANGIFFGQPTHRQDQ